MSDMLSKQKYPLTSYQKSFIRSFITRKNVILLGPKTSSINRGFEVSNMEKNEHNFKS